MATRIFDEPLCTRVGADLSGPLHTEVPLTLASVISLECAWSIGGDAQVALTRQDFPAGSHLPAMFPTDGLRRVRVPGVNQAWYGTSSASTA